MGYREDLAAVRAADPMLGDQLAGLANLEAVLNWIPRAGLSLAALDLVQQDEYCYDLLLPLADNQRWLTLGLT